MSPLDIIIAQKVAEDIQEINQLGPGAALAFWVFLGLLILGPWALSLGLSGSRLHRPNGYRPRGGVNRLQFGDIPNYPHGHQARQQNLVQFLDQSPDYTTVYWHRPRQTWVTDPAELHRP